MQSDTAYKTTKPHIRWMIRRDLDAVVDIEQRSFEFPWKMGDFIHCGRCRTIVQMVAERGERVVGFVVYELHRNRLHILNIAVHPEERRTGIAAAMMDKLKAKLSAQRRTAITLEVRESNLDAQLFFRAQGFEATAVLRDFYDDSAEDAYVMRYRLGEGDYVARDGVGY